MAKTNLFGKKHYSDVVIHVVRMRGSELSKECITGDCCSHHIPPTAAGFALRKEDIPVAAVSTVRIAWVMD